MQTQPENENKEQDLAELNQVLEEKDNKLIEAQIQLVQAQAQKIDTEKLAILGKLAGMVAHELNNSLTGIFVPLDQIMTITDIDEDEIWACWESDQDGKRLQEYLEKRRREIKMIKDSARLIEMAADRAKIVVEDLRGLVGERSQKLTKLNVAEVFRESSRLYYQRLQEVQVVEDFESEYLEITAARGDVGQILISLLLNAAHSLRERPNPTIWVSIFRKNNGIQIKVKDNGCGIPEEIQEQLFEPFFATKGVGASGLGLFTVKRILRSYLATIEIESKEDRGTTVTIWFPKDGKAVMMRKNQTYQ